MFRSLLSRELLFSLRCLSPLSCVFSANLHNQGKGLRHTTLWPAIIGLCLRNITETWQKRNGYTISLFGFDEFQWRWIRWSDDYSDNHENHQCLVHWFGCTSHSKPQLFLHNLAPLNVARFYPPLPHNTQKTIESEQNNCNITVQSFVCRIINFFKNMCHLSIGHVYTLVKIHNFAKMKHGFLFK